MFSQRKNLCKVLSIHLNKICQFLPETTAFREIFPQADTLYLSLLPPGDHSFGRCPVVEGPSLRETAPSSPEASARAPAGLDLIPSLTLRVIIYQFTAYPRKATTDSLGGPQLIVCRCRINWWKSKNSLKLKSVPRGRSSGLTICRALERSTTKNPR